jgi:predicted negative regulator of RcsB-dependent stress response
MDLNAAELPWSDRFWAWFDANRKPAITGVFVIIVVGAIAGFVAWHKSEKEAASSEAVSNVSVSQGLAGPGGQAGAAQEYLKVAELYPKSTAGARALLMAASSLFDEGKYEEARKQFERFTREYTANTLMGQAQLGIAASLDAQGKTNEAVTAYKNLVERHPNDSAVPQAKLSLGRIYEQQGKPEQARTQYEELLRNDQYGSLANEAGLRMEELKWKFPSLTPEAPAAPPAPTITPGLPGLSTNNTLQLKAPPK